MALFTAQMRKKNHTDRVRQRETETEFWVLKIYTELCLRIFNFTANFIQISKISLLRQLSIKAHVFMPPQPNKRTNQYSSGGK